MTVDVKLGIAMAKLPFLVEPEKHLAPNEHIAKKIYRSQILKLNANPKDKKPVIEFEQKLQELGYVDYISNLSSSDREKILNSKVKYFIPWRPVWNANSISTPCRMTFDASMSDRNGRSLNSLLAKGANSLNSLIGINLT